MEYQIVEHQIVVGRFPNVLDRDEAFEKEFMLKGRSGFKKEVKTKKW